MTTTSATTDRPTASGLLDDELEAALQDGERGLDALLERLPQRLSEGCLPRDRAACLLRVYGLRSGPVTERSRLAEHPAVAALRWSLERAWLRELAGEQLPGWVPGQEQLTSSEPAVAAEAAVRAMRAMAAHDRLPAVYSWAARSADYTQLQRFLTLEGGPDAGFDDLVAACQIGLSGAPKVELATNYWDEMGNGAVADVHTVVHDRMAQALQLEHLATAAQPVSGLERSALGGLLAANHWLQPEMVGALGLIELQAGPRCRTVVQGLTRVGAPADAFPFYEIHAEVDPRHGRDWLDHAVVPLVHDRPEWAQRIVTGAWWRTLLNARFFADVTVQLGVC